MGFDPHNCPLKIQESIETLTPKVGVHLEVWRFIPSHSPTLLGTWHVTIGLHSWPMPLQALALVASPRLGSRHYCFMATSSSFIFFYNGNINSKSFHKLQGYFKFICKEVIHSYIVIFLGFILKVQTCSKKLTSPRFKNLKKTNPFFIGHMARDMGSRLEKSTKINHLWQGWL
jgi:hypothetical protein